MGIEKVLSKINNVIIIMWYIIIILTLVYWSLYKIIKEYSWVNKYNLYLYNFSIINRLIAGK